MEKSVESFQKTSKIRTTIWSSNPTSRYVSKGDENRTWKRYLHSHVHRNSIHDCQKVEAYQWMNG